MRPTTIKFVAAAALALMSVGCTAQSYRNQLVGLHEQINGYPPPGQLPPLPSSGGDEETDSLELAPGAYR